MFQPRSDAQKIGVDSIKIPCRNGTSFTQDSIVRFELPRNIGFAQLSNAFLEMEIETQNPDLNAAGNLTQPALMLDRTAGASSLISRVSIRSEGRLIEELNGYNVFANLSNNATETQGSINKRTVQEYFLIKLKVYISSNENESLEATSQNGLCKKTKPALRICLIKHTCSKLFLTFEKPLTHTCYINLDS